jgi:hypothetical protein
MVAEANHFVRDVRQIGRDVGYVWAVAWIGLKKLVPKQDAVLVGHVIEIGVGAMAHLVTNDVQVGQGMHVKLGVEPHTWNTLHAFIQAPFAAASHHSHAVDRERQIFGIGNLVIDFANSEVRALRLRCGARDFKSEFQTIEILRTIAVGPPELRTCYMKFGRGLAIE